MEEIPERKPIYSGSDTTMTNEELLERSSSWTLACDNALLNRLKSFSDSIYQQSESILEDCDKLVTKINLLDAKVQTITNDFLMMSNSQFTENRVEEFQETLCSNFPDPTTKPPVRTRAENEAELVSKMKEAIQLGLSAKKRMRLNRSPSHSYELKLGHIIGTPKFFSSRFCGLLDESISNPSHIPNDSANIPDPPIPLVSIPTPPELASFKNPDTDNSNYTQVIVNREKLAVPKPPLNRPPSLTQLIDKEYSPSQSSDDQFMGDATPSTVASSISNINITQDYEGKRTIENKAPNLLSELNKAFKSKRLPSRPPSIDSDDDFRTPSPGKGLAKSLFNDDDEDIAGEGSWFRRIGDFPDDPKPTNAKNQTVISHRADATNSHILPASSTSHFLNIDNAFGISIPQHPPLQNDEMESTRIYPSHQKSNVPPEPARSPTPDSSDEISNIRIPDPSANKSIPTVPQQISSESLDTLDVPQVSSHLPPQKKMNSFVEELKQALKTKIPDKQLAASIKENKKANVESPEGLAEPLPSNFRGERNSHSPLIRQNVPAVSNKNFDDSPSIVPPSIPSFLNDKVVDKKSSPGPSPILASTSSKSFHTAAEKIESLAKPVARTPVFKREETLRNEATTSTIAASSDTNRQTAIVNKTSRTTPISHSSLFVDEVGELSPSLEPTATVAGSRETSGVTPARKFDLSNEPGTPFTHTVQEQQNSAAKPVGTKASVNSETVSKERLKPKSIFDDSDSDDDLFRVIPKPDTTGLQKSQTVNLLRSNSGTSFLENSRPNSGASFLESSRPNSGTSFSENSRSSKRFDNRRVSSESSGEDLFSPGSNFNTSSLKPTTHTVEQETLPTTALRKNDQLSHVHPSASADASRDKNSSSKHSDTATVKKLLEVLTEPKVEISKTLNSAVIAHSSNSNTQIQRPEIKVAPQKSIFSDDDEDIDSLFAKSTVKKDSTIVKSEMEKSKTLPNTSKAPSITIQSSGSKLISNVKENPSTSKVKQNPVTLKVKSIFSESDSDGDDLFKPIARKAKAKSSGDRPSSLTLSKGKSPPKSIFDDSEDDDLFTPGKNIKTELNKKTKSTSNFFPDEDSVEGFVKAPIKSANSILASTEVSSSHVTPVTAIFNGGKGRRIVKSVSQALNINPLALIPGARPPSRSSSESTTAPTTPDHIPKSKIEILVTESIASEENDRKIKKVDISYERGISLEDDSSEPSSLLPSIAKNRVKVKNRRPPSRQPKKNEITEGLLTPIAVEPEPIVQSVPNSPVIDYDNLMRPQPPEIVDGSDDDDREYFM